MKALATTLLVVGLAVFLASSALFVYHFATRGDPKFGDALAMAASAVLACFAVFLRSRVREGIRPFEITDTDRAEFQELRHEFGFRKFFGGLLSTLGGVMMVGGICSPFYTDSTFSAEWRTVVRMFALGLLLVLSAVPLVRQSK